MARALAFPSIVFDSTATVYVEDPATGAFTVLSRANLPCRLSTVSARNAASSGDRAELLALRSLLWPAAYDLPERCQIEIAGERWNPQIESFAAPTWPVTGAVVYRSVDVVRAR